MYEIIAGRQQIGSAQRFEQTQTLPGTQCELSSGGVSRSQLLRVNGKHKLIRSDNVSGFQILSTVLEEKLAIGAGAFGSWRVNRHVC